MRVKVDVEVDLRESLEYVESVIEQELPAVRSAIEEKAGTELKEFFYRGVTRFSASGTTLSFVAMTPVWYFFEVDLAMNRELKLMFDRNSIRIALPQVVVRDAQDLDTFPALQDRE